MLSSARVIMERGSHESFDPADAQWTGLADLPDVPPVGDDDLDCLAEVRDVLARHGKLNRFAVHLAHRHFALGPDEILIERPDPDGRTQHVDGRAIVGRTGRAPRPPAFSSQSTRCFFQMRSIASASPIRTGPMPASVTAKKSSSPWRGITQRDEAAKQRRIAEEKAAYDRGFPVAGHDENERGR